MEPGRGLDRVRRLVHRATGVVVEADYLIEARVHAIATRAGLSDQELLARAAVEDATALRRTLVEALLPYDSAFFRDHHPFESLRTEILPALLAARRPTRRLRVWSAGCAHGQEPYSVAILLLEHFPELAGWNVEIVATDVSSSALEAATAGRYDLLEVNRGLPARLLPRFFTREDKRFCVGSAVRALVRFERVNLAGRLPPCGEFDVVLLRNVLAHLDVATKRKVLEAVGGTLAPDGHLLLGAAEAADAIDPAWTRAGATKASAWVVALGACRA